MLNNVISLFLYFSLAVLVFSSCNSDNTKASKAENVVQSQQVSDEEEQTASKPTILFFGNSLTAGYGLDSEESFPSLIEDTVAVLGLDYNIVNAGLSGETTSGGLNRIDWVLNQNVDVFVLELGANDMLRGLPLDETKKNLKAIMDRVKAKYPKAKIVLAQMMAAPNLGKDYAQTFENIYPQLAKSESVALMPFFLQDLVGKPSLVLPDGKHPNADGQVVVADFIWSYLSKNIL